MLPTATAEYTATPTVTPGPVVYTVQEEDLLGAIALRFDVSLEQLLEANGLSEDSLLSVGQELIIPTRDADEDPGPTTAPSAEPIIHTVARGEVLGTIAKQYGVEPEAIAEANGLSVEDLLSIGQELVIPLPAPPDTSGDSEAPAHPPSAATMTVVHTVASGDTLGSIAAEYGVSVEAIADASGIEKDAMLSIGQELVIPGVATSGAPESDANSGLSAAPTAEPTASQTVHVVKAGDNLSYLAATYDVSMEEIAEANGISVTDTLSLGQELVIPSAPPSTPTVRATNTPAPTQGAPTMTPAPSPTAVPTIVTTVTHVVAAGDTLGSIAREYGVAAETIAQASGIRLTSVLSVGQELTIPDVMVSGTLTPTPAPPEAEPVPTATLAASSEVVHTVQRGDTLGSIAVEYGVRAEAIAEANGIQLTTILSVGQELTIPGLAQESAPETAATQPPAASTNVEHVVTADETLGAIAAEYGVAAEEIAEANGISLTSMLSIGQKLIIPGVASPEAPDAPPSEAISSALTTQPSPFVYPTSRPRQAYSYREPNLLAPVNGSRFSGTGARILLNWNSVGVLKSNEWYLLRVWRSAQDKEPIEVWTKATSWRPTRDLYTGQEAPRTARWQVLVMAGTPGSNEFKPLSSPSETYEFRLE